MQIISTCTVWREGSGKQGEAVRGSSLEPGCLYMKALSSVLYNEPAAPVGCWGGWGICKLYDGVTSWNLLLMCPIFTALYPCHVRQLDACRLCILKYLISSLPNLRIQFGHRVYFTPPSKLIKLIGYWRVKMSFIHCLYFLTSRAQRDY